jgi:hypothetical protein
LVNIICEIVTCILIENAFFVENKLVSLQVEFMFFEYGYTSGDNIGYCAGTYGVFAGLK